MKIIKKISITFLCIYFLWNISFVKAIDIPTGKSVVFYAPRTYNDIYYDGEELTIPIAMSIYGSKKIPIYSLKKEGKCLNGAVSYYVTVDEIEKNEQVRQILLQGYPNCTFKELGCSSEDEGYIITQIAIWDAYYNYDLTKFTTTNTNRYSNIISNMTNFIKKMRALSIDKVNYQIDIDEKSIKWNDEENGYNSKTYEILNNLNLNEYTVEILALNEVDEGKVEKIQIRNENDELQSNFSVGENFKIFIPYNLNIEFEIIVKVKAETNPIRKGIIPAEGWEPYVFLGDTETLEINLIQEHTYVETLEEDLELGEDEKESEKDDEVTNDEEDIIITKTYSQKQEIKKLPQTGF